MPPNIVGRDLVPSQNKSYAYLFLNINQLDALNFIISLFQASTCFEHTCSTSGARKLYYTVSGIITLNQVSGLKLLKKLKLLKYNSISMSTLYYHVLILIELYFNNFNYFSNFRPLPCFSVMIPEAV